ncbi:MAG: bacteriocin family protein [Proteobacteria bacterium]|nr:bacteriocin family protein [Pseudomonadota bacterium]
MNANVDLIGRGESQGIVAEHLNANGALSIGAMKPFIDLGTGKAFISTFKGGDPAVPANYVVSMVANATLRRDEWKTLDDAILKISETRLNGIADLLANGLTYQLGNAMGTTVLEWHDVSDALSADLTMDGVTRGQNDRPKFQHNYLPIPIIHADYEINARVLAASRSLGNPLDTTLAERAARKVNEKLENMLFTNTTYSFGAVDSRSRNSIYSYVNHPDRNQVTMTVAWDDSAKTAAQILAEVLSLKQTSIDAKHYGPWMLYIPTAYETVLDEDYDTTTPGTTIRERILKIAGIKGVKVIDTLPANNVVFVQMTSDVVRLIQGMGIQNVQWQTEGQFINKYKVITIQVPQIRSDQDGNSGVTHLAM